MSKMDMLNEMKANNYITKERVSSKLWNGKVSKEYIEMIYAEYKIVKG